MLKVIAFISMLIDHLYKSLLIPENMFTVAAGRMAFPLFAFCVAEGAYYTKNRLKYISMMCVFAVLSEMPFDLMVYGHFDMRGQNVLWTFSFALLAIYIADILSRGKGKLIWYILSSLLFNFISALFFTDYCMTGVFCVVWLYTIRKGLCGNNETGKLASQILCIIVMNINILLITGDISQLAGVLSIIPIMMYNGQKGGRGPFWKMFFAAYPSHMALIYLLRMF